MEFHTKAPLSGMILMGLLNTGIANSQGDFRKQEDVPTIHIEKISCHTETNLFHCLSTVGKSRDLQLLLAFVIEYKYNGKDFVKNNLN